jgi:hypothetical protein
MNFANTIFMTIPIVFDFDKMNIKTNEDKQLFIDKFIKEVINVPLTRKFIDKDGNVKDICMGVITEAKQAENYTVNAFAMSYVNVGTEFSIQKVNDSKIPLDIKTELKVSSLYLNFYKTANENLFKFSQKQRDIARKIENIYNKEGYNNDK